MVGDCVCLREVPQLHSVCEQECECNTFLVSVSVNGSNNKLCTGGAHICVEI